MTRRENHNFQRVQEHFPQDPLRKILETRFSWKNLVMAFANENIFKKCDFEIVLVIKTLYQCKIRIIFFDHLGIEMSFWSKYRGSADTTFWNWVLDFERFTQNSLSTKHLLRPPVGDNFSQIVHQHNIFLRVTKIHKNYISWQIPQNHHFSSQKQAK